MYIKAVSVAALSIVGVISCANSVDSCEDLEGTITHTETEITGIQSVTLLSRNTSTGGLQAIDSSTGISFSDLVIQLDLSWIDEQHRFRAPSTYIESFTHWLMSPAYACTLTPPYQAFQPTAVSIDLYSDGDLNSDYTAGNSLASVFGVNGDNDDRGANRTLLQSVQDNTFPSARSYRIEPVFRGGTLTTAPAVNTEHNFTVTLTLDDGRAFNIRTPAVFINGV